MPPDHDNSRGSNQSGGQRRSRVLNDALVSSHGNLYQVLELTKTASEDDIKRAYRRLALRFHPDKNQNDPEASKKFQEINYANTVLSNPTKRRIYDQYGEMGLKMIEQLGEDRMTLALRPWVKWLVCTLTFLTCGCFCCCCCCFCCFQCCCNFCCGKCKPEGMRDFDEYVAERDLQDSENPIRTQPEANANSNFTSTTHVTLICEQEQQHQQPSAAALAAAAVAVHCYDPPPPYSPSLLVGPNSPNSATPMPPPTTYGSTAGKQ